MRISTTLTGVVILMTGCLTVPAPGDEDQGRGNMDGDDGDEGDPDPGVEDPEPGIVPTCETKLDLAFVSRFEAPASGPEGPSSSSFDGFALFVNAGDETLDLSGATVEVRGVNDGGATAAIWIEESPLALPSGEAHGVLPTDLDEVVLGRVPENWSSTESPGMSVDIEHALLGGSYTVDFDVRAGELLFPMRVAVDVVGDDSRWIPLESARVAGTCNVVAPD